MGDVNLEIKLNNLAKRVDDVSGNTETLNEFMNNSLKSRFITVPNRACTITIKGTLKYENYFILVQGSNNLLCGLYSLLPTEWNSSLLKSVIYEGTGATSKFSFEYIDAYTFRFSTTDTGGGKIMIFAVDDFEITVNEE